MKTKHYFVQFLLLCCAALGISACNNGTNNTGNPEQSSTSQKQTEEKSDEKEKVVVALQPFDDFTQKETQKLADELRQHWKELRIEDNWEFHVMPPFTPGKDLLIESKARLEADKILDHFEGEANAHHVILVLTHKDIATRAIDRPGGKGPNGWGVLGLSRLNSHVSAISTYREKNKSLFWKTVTHEFLHSHYGLPHCPGNDLTCIMKDAEGKPKTHLQTGICDKCRAAMKK